MAQSCLETWVTIVFSVQGKRLFCVRISEGFLQLEAPEKSEVSAITTSPNTGGDKQKTWEQKKSGEFCLGLCTLCGVDVLMLQKGLFHTDTHLHTPAHTHHTHLHTPAHTHHTHLHIHTHHHHHPTPNAHMVRIDKDELTLRLPTSTIVNFSCFPFHC